MPCSNNVLSGLEGKDDADGLWTHNSLVVGSNPTGTTIVYQILINI